MVHATMCRWLARAKTAKQKAKDPGTPIGLCICVWLCVWIVFLLACLLNLLTLLSVTRHPCLQNRYFLTSVGLTAHQAVVRKLSSWHDAKERLLSAAGGAYWPLATLCPPSVCLAYPCLPSVRLVGWTNRSPRLSLFHCSVLGRGYK